VHIALPSAIGNASRRNRFWPDEVARPFCFVATPERDQREPETQ
jgi:hypothetical protein